jgi:hypothetical protein
MKFKALISIPIVLLACSLSVKAQIQSKKFKDNYKVLAQKDMPNNGCGLKTEFNQFEDRERLRPIK